MNGAIKITAYNYSETDHTEKEVDVSECLNYRNMPGVTWIDIRGVMDKESIRRIGECYGLHQLVRENIEEQYKRPKIEDFGEYHFIILNTLVYLEEKDSIATEAFYMILAKNYVITFRQGETTDHVLEPVKKRIRAAGSRVRRSGADYLVYRIVDSLIDNYFTVMEWFGEKMELLEDDVLMTAEKGTLLYMQKQRRELLSMRESIWPLRAVLNSLQRGESLLIKPETRIYMRDIYDHLTQVMDTIEMFRDAMSAMLEVYVSNISNKLNEVMKILTIISTIFIPLTFVTSLYGMNFRYMPEIGWQYGYTMTWAIMAGIVIIMLSYFRRKKWF
jgi:magnesium transporter